MRIERTLMQVKSRAWATQLEKDAAQKENREIERHAPLSACNRIVRCTYIGWCTRELLKEQVQNRVLAVEEVAFLLFCDSLQDVRFSLGMSRGLSRSGAVADLRSAICLCDNYATTDTELGYGAASLGTSTGSRSHGQGQLPCLPTPPLTLQCLVLTHCAMLPETESGLLEDDQPFS